MGYWLRCQGASRVKCLWVEPEQVSVLLRWASQEPTEQRLTPLELHELTGGYRLTHPGHATRTGSSRSSRTGRTSLSFATATSAIITAVATDGFSD